MSGALENSGPAPIRSLALFIRALRICVETAAVLIFLSFVVAVAAQVFWRYVLNDSIFWAEEYVRFALYWMTMLSIAIAADRKAHIVMDLLHTSVGETFRKVLDWINAAVSVVFLAILSYYGVQLVNRSHETMSPVTEISMSWVYLAAPIGCLAAIVFTIDALVRPRQIA